MDVIFTNLEIEILAYLHENAKGFGISRGHDFYIPKIEEDLGANKDEVRKAISYLAEWGLVSYHIPELGQNIFFTGNGEQYMRNLERALKENKKVEAELKGQSLTLTVFKKMGAVVQEIIVQVGAQIITKHIDP